MMKFILFLIFLLPFCLSDDQQPPNIIFFFADDLGYGDVGFTGNPTIRTPNLDMMASQGMRFNQFYSAAAICSPSRGSLLTGRLPIRTGIYSAFNYPLDNIFRVFYPWSTGSLPVSEITLPTLLKQKDYQSSIIGKWHLGHANNSLPFYRGFDHFYGLPYSQDEGCPPGYNMTCEHEWQHIWPGVPLYRNTTIVQQPVDLQTLVPRYTAEAKDFIKNSVSDNKPFFLYLAYDEVHVPLFASKDFLGTSLRGLFGDAVQEMDGSIGDILNYLVELDIHQNTFSFFTSDNGPWKKQQINGGSSGQFRGGKGTTYEGGFREPAVAYWPGVVNPGQVNFDISSSMDLFVTALDLANVSVPSDRVIDGVSLVPALLNQGKVDRECYFYYRSKFLQAVRCNQYKINYFTRCGFCTDPPVYHYPPLMYNVDEDPEELYNLNTTMPEYAKIIDDINAVVAKHNTTLDSYPQNSAQLDGISLLVAPCCNNDHKNRCQCGNDHPHGGENIITFID